MEINRKSRTLLLLPALLYVCVATNDDCPPTDADFSCYTDYNETITCLWTGTGASDHAACTAKATKLFPFSSKFSQRNCMLQPVHVSAPSPLACSMHLGKRNAFQSYENWTVAVKCNSSHQTLKKITFKPSCSIKLKPPGKPDVNFTTVSWVSQPRQGLQLTFFKSELQWKEEDQSWNDSLVGTVHCKDKCEKELDPEKLFQGQRYEARTRVLVDQFDFKSTWSDWSPTTSWVSPVGQTKPPDVTGDFSGMIIAGAVTLTVFMVALLLRTKSSTWVAKMIRGPPTPNPATSFLQKADFQSWLSPHFTEAFHSFMKQEEIHFVEVAYPVDAVAPCKPESALLEKCESGSGSGSSSYSNPNYSHLCLPPPIALLSAGNLQPCAADTPYGPVADQGAADEAQRSEGGERENQSAVLRLLCHSDKDGESVQVVSDYETVERVQVERTRLRSLDSGVGSGEEVSQESLESDSITVADGHDEPVNKGEEAKSGNDKDVDFRKLFGGSGGISGGSIQVCAGYERVQKLPADGLELPSLDSGASSGAEERGGQEEDVDKATESTGLLFPPAPSFPLPRPTWSFPHLPLKVSELGVRPDPQPALHHVLERNPSKSMSRSVAPSGDGYMPVTQEQT